MTVSITVILQIEIVLVRTYLRRKLKVGRLEIRIKLDWLAGIINFGDLLGHYEGVSQFCHYQLVQIALEDRKAECPQEAMGVDFLV